MATGMTHDEVTAELDALQRAYESVPVRQTTMTVTTDEYDRVAAGSEDGVVDACVRVRDGDQWLLVSDGGGWTDPVTTVSSGDRIERVASRFVTERTGVDCQLTDLQHVTIVGITDAEDVDRPPVYRLAAVFEAKYLGGTPVTGAQWRTDGPGIVAY